MRSKSDASDTDGVCQPLSQKRIQIVDREAWLPPLRSNNNDHFSASKTKQHRDQNPHIQYRNNPLTLTVTSFFIEREEKVAFAKVPQKPNTTRIFTFQTVSLPLNFQRSQSQCLTHCLCHSCFTCDMCKRLFNDSAQCQRGHLGQTVHTPKWVEQMITKAHLMSKLNKKSN